MHHSTEGLHSSAFSLLSVKPCPCYIFPPDITLTLYNLLQAVSTVREFWYYGGLLDYLGVPAAVMDQIISSQSYSSEDEKRKAGLQYYLQTVPGASWVRIAGVLWYMEEHTALKNVRQYLPHEHGKYNNMIIIYRLTNVHITCSLC